MPDQVTYSSTDPRYTASLAAAQQQMPTTPPSGSDRLLALAELMANANPVRGAATFGVAMPLNPGGAIQRAFLGLNYDSSLLQRLNDLIAKRTDYGHRLESGKPGTVLHWANSSADWKPEVVGKALRIEDARRLPLPATEFSRDYHKALFTGNRVLDANMVYLPKVKGITKPQIEAVTPWLDQLPLYSGGPHGGSFENKMKRAEQMRKMRAE